MNIKKRLVLKGKKTAQQSISKVLRTFGMRLIGYTLIYSILLSDMAYAMKGGGGGGASQDDANSSSSTRLSPRKKTTHEKSWDGATRIFRPGNDAIPPASIGFEEREGALPSEEESTLALATLDGRGTTRIFRPEEGLALSSPR